MNDYKKLQGLLGACSDDQLRRSHKGWVEEQSGDGAKERQDEWKDSVAKVLFESENEDIDHENTVFWDVNDE